MVVKIWSGPQHPRFLGHPMAATNVGRPLARKWKERQMILPRDENEPKRGSCELWGSPCGCLRKRAHRSGRRIMFNGCVVREGKPVTIGENSIVMENAVLRSTDKHELVIGNHRLIGPHALLSAAGLTILSSSTGAAVFMAPASEPRLKSSSMAWSACARNHLRKRSSRLAGLSSDPGRHLASRKTLGDLGCAEATGLYRIRVRFQPRVRRR